MGQSYNINKKALVELTAITAAAVTDKTAWFVEIGLVSDPNKESKIIPMDELETLIDTDTTATASNVGSGDGQIYKQKTGIDLELRRLIAGTNITISTGTNDVTINSSAGGGGTSIEDAGATTGLYTEETADTLVGHSAGTGTAIIFEMFEGTGTPVSVFQIDGNGNLRNNNVFTSAFLGTGNSFIQTRSLHASLSGNNSTCTGLLSGNALAAGHSNTTYGAYSGYTMTIAFSNALYGYFTGAALVGGDKNAIFGAGAGQRVTGDGCVFLGYNAGNRQVSVSNKFIVNNYAIANAATELTDSLIVGDFHATVASQALRFNCGTLTKNGYPILAEDAAGDVTVSNEITAADFILA